MENSVSIQDKIYQAKVLRKSFTAPNGDNVKYFDIILYINNEEIHCSVKSDYKRLLSFLIGE